MFHVFVHVGVLRLHTPTQTRMQHSSVARDTLFTCNQSGGGLKRNKKRHSTPKNLLSNDVSPLRISRPGLLASDRGRECTHCILLLCSLHLGAERNIIICSGPGVSESNLNQYLARPLLPVVRGGRQRRDRDGGERLAAIICRDIGVVEVL